MKLVVLSRKFDSEARMSYGPFPFIFHLVKKLKDKVDLTVISSHIGKPKTEIIDGIKVIKVFSPGSDFLKTNYYLYNLLAPAKVRQEKPDIIHAHDTGAGLVLKLLKNFPVPKVSTIYSMIKGFEKARNVFEKMPLSSVLHHKVIHYWEKLLLINSDKIIAPTNFEKDDVLKYIPVPENKNSPRGNSGP